MNKWRLIITKPCDAYLNMAVDKALLELSEVPTLRFFQWQPPAVSIGCFQGLLEEVNVEKCKESGIDFVRRITGGGAVFHDQELTYSVFLKEDNPYAPKDLRQSYKSICEAIILGLKYLGLKAVYAPLNDIIVSGKKISGCAQTRRYKKILQHGTLLMGVDVEKMFSILKVPDEKIRDKMIANVKERVTSIEKELGSNIDPVESGKAIRRGFEDKFKIEFFEESLTSEELELAQKIKKEQFSQKSWNYAR